jgi:Protein of unknown function (DUF1194)
MTTAAHARMARPTIRRWRRAVLGLIAPLLALLFSPPATAADVDLNLVLAVDVSDSIDASESQLQRQGYINAFRNPEVIEAIRSGRTGRIAIAYFEWADVGEQSLIINWMVIGDLESAKAFGDRLTAAATNSGHFTSISAAITYALGLLKAAPHQSDRRVIDVSGDGRNNDGPPLDSARAAAQAWDITINGLPIDNERSRLASDMEAGQIAKYYREQVIMGPGAFIVEAKSFEDFEHAISRKLLREIASAPQERKTAVHP